MVGTQAPEKKKKRSNEDKPSRRSKGSFDAQRYRWNEFALGGKSKAPYSWSQKDREKKRGTAVSGNWGKEKVLKKHLTHQRRTGRDEIAFVSCHEELSAVKEKEVGRGIGLKGFS